MPCVSKCRFVVMFLLLFVVFPLTNHQNNNHFENTDFNTTKKRDNSLHTCISFINWASIIEFMVNWFCFCFCFCFQRLLRSYCILYFVDRPIGIMLLRFKLKEEKMMMMILRKIIGVWLDDDAWTDRRVQLQPNELVRIFCILGSYRSYLAMYHS